MPRPRRRPKADRRCALELLASCRHGCTEAIVLAHGVSMDMMVELVRAVHALSPVRRTIEGRLRITEAGARYAGRCEVTGSGQLTERTMAKQIDDDERSLGRPSHAIRIPRRTRSSSRSNDRSKP
jgi:P2-related tail formation protein